ncbi:hypothetical protein [Tistlia consotensis]|uniref:hypothetical protein n=1 Tax=Tistlia consotensis TaxID=1321365 RepID=UPI00117D1C1E|nr:hypothetical protein [Tistlia consotensis]
MREEPPFRFDLTALIQRARRELARRTDGVSVTLSLPFLSFTATPADIERRVAREVVIRMSDRRVLSAQECCDTCIDQALESLQSIRSVLVDKQVELAHLADGPLYLLLEVMLEGVRQFLTFEQRLSSQGHERDYGDPRDFHRPLDQREAYFGALEALRGHLSRCLGQVAVIANVELPSIGMIAAYQEAWPLEAYTKRQPKLP